MNPNTNTLTLARTRLRLRSGFTLIELLVVIALTSVLVVLLFKPLLDSYNLTSRAGTQIESQAAARDTLRELQATLSNATYVYDNNTDAAGINMWLANKDGSAALTRLKFAMIEFVAPAKQSDQSLTGNPYTDPTTGLPITDPTAKPGQRGIALPVVQGRSIQRLFIGLRDNRSADDKHVVNTDAFPGDATQSGMPAIGNDPAVFHGYASRWDEPATATTGADGKDNRTTLYSAEFTPFVKNPFYDPANATANPQFVINFGLFHTDPSVTHANDDPTKPIILDDPNFFYDSTLAGYGGNKGDAKWAVPGWRDLNNDGKVQIFENWAAISSSLLPTYKADAIELQRDNRNQILYYKYDANHVPTEDTDPTDRPIARALVSFSPTAVQNDPGIASSLNGSDAETPLVAASSFASQHGAWMNPYTVTVFRIDDPTKDPVSDPNNIVYTLKSTDTVFNNIVRIGNSVGPAISLINTNGELTPDNVIFAPPAAGAMPEMAFLPDARRGRVNFAFPQSVYVHRPSPDTTSTANFGTVPNGPLGQVYDPAAINANRDSLNNTKNPFYGKRYVWLKDLDTTLYNVANITPALAAGARSPLDVFYKAIDQPQQIRIVPGSERVFGPDQRPGPHYGFRIQYSRVSSLAGEIGLNEYKINYDLVKNAANAGDPDDPRVQAGFIEFDSTPDTGNAVNLSTPETAAPTDNPEDPAGVFVHSDGKAGPPVYRPHGLPQRKALGGANELADPIEVTYLFQLNRPNDVVKMDYLSRDKMNISLEARLYDPATAAPQTTPLTAQVSVRNLQR